MDKVIHHSVRLACGCQKAFEMFTVNECLQKWLTEKADVEPKVGGKYELFWNPKDRRMTARSAARCWPLMRTSLCVSNGRGLFGSSTL